jgi:cytochrome c5
MRRLLFLVFVGIGACGGEPDSAARADAPPDPVPAAAADLDAETMAKWSRSCALCHVNGEGGAPRLGDHAAWSARLAQGEAQLLEHTVEGYNNMPPLGYCMDCERSDFLALIRFMAAPPASGS